MLPSRAVPGKATGWRHRADCRAPMVVIHCANLQKRTHSHGQGTSVGSQRNAGILASVRRAHSVPEQLGLAGIGAAAASFVYPAASHATGLGLPCPLRTLTGIPCPLCGMTTAATGLAAGDVHAALAANPFVLALAAGTLWMTALFVARIVGTAPPPAPWSEAARRRAWRVAGVLAAASWAFQLHRVGVA
jgi:Protein of unknown function (DUF2752)